MTSLEEKWCSVTKNLPKDICDRWWSLLLNQYMSGCGRSAHDVKFLTQKFEEMSNLESHIKNLDAFIFALFFQYFHYDTKCSQFYENNINEFKKFTQEVGLDEKIANQVLSLLENSSSPLTEAHTTAGVYGNDDVHYFLDLDMLPLGKSYEIYYEYKELVSKEYSSLDEPSYRKLRQKILQSFLLIPNIYATKIFRDNYEIIAKSNVENELKMM